MADSYYVRVRGEVKGPLSREQILSEIRKKRLGRHHELSEDAVHWQRAGDIPELFEAQVANRNTHSNAATADAPQAATPAAAAEDYNTGWYFAKGRNNIGPVKIDDIKSMLVTRRLKGTNRVWHGSLPDWTPISELPQFVDLLAAPVGTDSGERIGSVSVNDESAPKASFLEIVMGTSKGASLPDDAIYKFPNLSRYLLVAEAAFRILYVILLLVVVGGFVVFVGVLVNDNSANIPLKFSYLVGAGFALILQVVVLWFLFISCMAALELTRVLIKIEDNTTRPLPHNE